MTDTWRLWLTNGNSCEVQFDFVRATVTRGPIDAPPLPPTNRLPLGLKPTEIVCWERITDV